MLGQIDGYRSGVRGFGHTLLPHTRTNSEIDGDLTMIDAITYEAFREVLNTLRPGWVTKGDTIVGPGGAAVRLAGLHEASSDGHIDVQFVMDDVSPKKVQLWDCVTGYGATTVDRARFAAHLWGQTTAAALLELKYSRQGEFADHYHATDAGGFSGWHAIAGAISALAKARVQVPSSGGGSIIRCSPGGCFGGLPERLERAIRSKDFL